jgi:hypothetical protein
LVAGPTAAGPSVLTGLFRRVSDPDATHDSLEDFTTEALAGAIRRDPRPILTTLARTGALDTSRVIGEPLTVFTQRSHVLADDSIRLDLVLLWTSLPLEVWIEVKTGSPLSGDRQLVRYLDAQAALTANDAVERPPLVLLSEVDLRFASSTPAPSAPGRSPSHMAWQDIIEAVRDTDHPDTLWLELVSFLKEKGMTQDSTFPISAREATSLSDSHQLYLKSVKLVTEVNSRAAARFQQLSWWTPGQIAVFVQKQFRDKGRYTLGVWNKSAMGLLFGLETGRAGEATYTVWLETDPRNAQVRPMAHARADSARLHDAGWELSYDGWKILKARAHTVNFATLDEAATWFVDRFAELEAAGLLDLLLQLRSSTAQSPEDSSEEIPA